MSGRHSHPTSASRMDSELDAALDYLGYNPLEQVPFAINPAFVPPRDLIRRTEELLARPLPAEEGLAANRWAFDGQVERQVIQQVRF